MPIANAAAALVVWMKMITDIRTKSSSLTQRLLVIIILLPVGIGLVILGGIYFNFFLTLILSVSAWEYVQLARKGGYRPAQWLVISGTAVVALSRSFVQFQYADLIISVIILVAITVHLLDYEKGRDNAGTDFAITLGGIFYIGWLGFIHDLGPSPAERIVVVHVGAAGCLACGFGGIPDR